MIKIKKPQGTILIVIIFLLSCKSSTTQSTTYHTPMKDSTTLEGTWQLKAIPGNSIAFEKLYPKKNPVIVFDLEKKLASGYTGCNSFSGKLDKEGFAIRFMEPISITNRFCTGEGESIFIQRLKEVTSYSITNDSLLTLFKGEIAILEMTKK
ncbi:MAG: META domain-containing protein [Chitinophagaceae bacterium]